MIRIYCSKADATLQETETLTAGMVNTPVVQFTFSSDWNGLGKSAIVRAGTVIKEVVVSNDRIVIPSECLAKAGVNLIIGVWGGNFTTELPTVWCACGEIQDATNPYSALNHEEGTPSNVAQMLAAAERAEAALDQIENANWDDVAQRVGADKVNKPLSSPNGIAGQILQTNGNGTTQWVDQIRPTDEQVDTSISTWLDNHPEATTTVQDGAITIKKLSDDVAPRYVIFPSVNPNLTPPGQCMAITYKDHAFLIDIGRVEAFISDIDPQLHSYGVTTIDGILISHFHGDHDGNPFSYNDYSYLSSSFNTENCVFYLPLTPPDIVPAADKDLEAETLLRNHFTDNEFKKPPFGTIYWHGYEITTCNDTQADYDYYEAQNIIDNNAYSIITHIEFNSVSITNFADAVAVAQTRQYNLGHLKQSTIITDPHHGLEGQADARIMKVLRPQYIYINDSYRAAEIGYRSPLLAEASRIGCTIIMNTQVYPTTCAGNINNFITLSGSSEKFTPYSVEGVKHLYINELVDLSAYQDGTEQHPYKNIIRALNEARDTTEIHLLSDVTYYPTIQWSNGFIKIIGNGHSMQYLILARGANVEIENVTVSLQCNVQHNSKLLVGENVKFLQYFQVYDSIVDAVRNTLEYVTISCNRSTIMLAAGTYIGTKSITSTAVPELSIKSISGIRDQTNTSAGNIYGEIKDGVAYIYGWVTLGTIDAVNLPIVTGLPKSKYNTPIIFSDGSAGGIDALYMAANSGIAVSQSGLSARSTHTISFFASYEVSEI